ncbi:hypothetical protein A3844_23780 [Paenibacillus helianthi]|uniref:Uncharacterized protein n=1 Tax=Paenibacillus helianthi TaxID=1349432 RepID=A0ABX3EJU9_9BACL|nr:hypothetical protein A3842_27310 [Paenibacillus sp. P3E]OKP82716.1 hypothetical protein A3844_23780 [Paenibacillus helianthi]
MQDGSSDRISSPKKLLRSPFTDYELVKENITYIGFYIHPLILLSSGYQYCTKTDQYLNLCD